VPTVRRCEEGDWPAVVETIAAAFHDYPPMRWMIEADGYEERLRTVVGLMTREQGLQRREIWVADDVASVAVWETPEHRASPDSGLGPLARRIMDAQGERAEYASRSWAIWEAAHPERPHWFLRTLGTRPDRQRQGLGAAVCRPVLDRLDEEGMPAFVDTSTAGNVRLYERLGFATIAEWDMPEGGPHGWAMWREPGVGSI
jgi:GNAT superfamily N-acetyltransferase